MKTITAYGIVAGITLSAFGWFYANINPNYVGYRRDADAFAESEDFSAPYIETAPYIEAYSPRKTRNKSRISELQKEIGRTNIEGKRKANEDWFEHKLKLTKKFWETPEFMNDDSADEIYERNASENYQKARNHFASQAKKGLELKAMGHDDQYERESEELNDQYEQRRYEIEKARAERAKARAEKVKSRKR